MADIIEDAVNVFMALRAKSSPTYREALDAPGADVDAALEYLVSRGGVIKTYEGDFSTFEIREWTLEDDILDDVKEYGVIDERSLPQYLAIRDPQEINGAVERLCGRGLVKRADGGSIMGNVLVDGNRQRAIRTRIILELYSSPLPLQDSDVLGLHPYFTREEIHEATQELERRGELEILHGESSSPREYILPESARRLLLETAMDVSLN